MIHLRRFQGQVPRVKALRQIHAYQATVAKNCRLWGGVLEPFKTTRRVYKPSKAGTKKALHLWGKVSGANAEGAISAVLNTTPVRLTIAGHGRTTGQRVFVTATGLAIDNATYALTVVDANTISLDGTSAAGTASTGQWTIQNGYWFHWTAIVNALKGPIAGDTTERTYYTGDGVPKVTDSTIATAGGGTDYPNNSYTLGIPAPAAAIVATPQTRTGAITGATQANPCQINDVGHGRVTGDKVYISGVGGMTQLNGNIYTITVVDADNFTLDGVNSTAYGAYTSGGTWEQRYDDADKEAVAYVYTYVSAWGEEGPPAAVSNIVTIGPGQQVDLSAMSVAPAGNYNITLKRIYRAVTGDTGTSYLRVTEIAVATTTYSDSKLDSALGSELPSVDWDAPPSDMAGIIALPNSVVVGYSKNQVCPSVPSQPHAYPTGWRQTTDANIVGLGNIHNAVVACTRGHPYFGDGADPANLSLTKIENNQACVSGPSIVSVGTVGVVYASGDGLIFIGPGGNWENISEAYFTPQEWKELIKPESIHAYALDNRYIAFYDNGTTQGAFIFSPRDKAQGLIFLDTYATAGYVDLEGGGDALYLQIGDYIERWEGGSTDQTYTWRSKWHYGPKQRYGVLKVIAESYTDLTVRVYANGGATLIHTAAVKSSKSIRFYPDKRFTDWVVELVGTDAVHDVFVARDVDELRAMLKTAGQAT